jgi:starch phosphorylase
LDGKDCIAYFTMEIGLSETMPTYAGGLGILAGDTVRSAADLGIEMVAVTLLYRKGYFRQKLDASGWQTEEDTDWPVAELLQELKPRCSIEIEGRQVQVRAWKHEVKGVSGATAPVLFLDTDLEQNAKWDRGITHHLYGGDAHYRLCQEVVLGIGGVRMLRALGYSDIKRYHMNEGHAALLTLELAYTLSKQAWDMAYEQIRHSVTAEVLHLIKPKCIFTTHTPVPAGHDAFPLELVGRVITGYRDAFYERAREFCPEGVLDMTFLALDHSHYVNGVAKRHGKVTQQLFSKYDIHSITNGVHAATWAAPPIANLFDERIPGWREDNSSLRYALNISKREVWSAHRQAKQLLIDKVKALTGIGLEPDVFTIGFARRTAEYKRAELLFWDIGRLTEIASSVGTLQLVFAGKAHPQDTPGKEVIRRIHQVKEALRGGIELVYLADYGIELAKLITAGVDLWLNTPQPPLEASGTSGMKAAVNGVPSFSILDGWWVEGCIEGVTGWAIGGHEDAGLGSDETRAEDAHALYNKLEMTILRMFSSEPDRYAEVMRHSIALNASFFNTERMLSQYITKAYFK